MLLATTSSPQISNILARSITQANNAEPFAIEKLINESVENLVDNTELPHMLW